MFPFRRFRDDRLECLFRKCNDVSWCQPLLAASQTSFLCRVVSLVQRSLRHNRSALKTENAFPSSIIIITLKRWQIEERYYEGFRKLFRRLRLFSSVSFGASNVINSFLLSTSSAARPSRHNKRGSFNCFDFIEIFSCAIIMASVSRAKQMFSLFQWNILMQTCFNITLPQFTGLVSDGCEWCRQGKGFQHVNSVVVGKRTSALSWLMERELKMLQTIFYANAAFLISSGRGKIFRDVARTWKVKRRA